MSLSGLSGNTATYGVPQDEIIPRISGQSASGRLTRGSGNFWLSDVDVTGVCVNGVGGYLIDRSTVIHPTHRNVPVGATVDFQGSDNQTVTRTVSAIQPSVGGSDIQLSTLDSPVPGTVTPFGIFRSPVPARAVRLDQFGQAWVIRVSAGNTTGFGLETDYPDWSRLPVTYDSGYPILALSGRVLYVIASTFTSGGGPRIAAYL